jgi:hypothetical protein
MKLKAIFKFIPAYGPAGSRAKTLTLKRKTS